MRELTLKLVRRMGTSASIANTSSFAHFSSTQALAQSRQRRRTRLARRTAHLLRVVVLLLRFSFRGALWRAAISGFRNFLSRRTANPADSHYRCQVGLPSLTAKMPCKKFLKARSVPESVHILLLCYSLKLFGHM